MSNDKLLEALAAAARDSEAADTLDKDWDSYSAGQLSEAKLAELKARNGQPHAAAEAFRPLGDDFREALAIKAQETLAPGDAAPADNTVAFPARQRRVFAPLALAASVVFGVALALRMLPGPEISPLPGYSAAMQGGSEFRSDPAPVDRPVFRAGDRLELRLTPDTAVEGELAGIAIAPHPDNLNLFNSVQVDVAPSGAARVVGSIGSDPGDYRLLVSIGRAAALPDETALAAALAAKDQATGPGWQAWSYEITVKP